MATLKTIKKTHAIITNLGRIIPGSELGMVLMDRKGIVPFPGRKGRTGSQWGTGSIAQERKRLGQGILERAYRELPFNMLRRFVLFTGNTDSEPTKKEFGVFERRLCETIRRIYNRITKERMNKLPRPVGRKERNRERTKLIVKTVRQYEKKGWSRTAAVKQTASDLAPCDRATIWRHLASAKSSDR